MAAVVISVFIFVGFFWVRYMLPNENNQCKVVQSIPEQNIQVDGQSLKIPSRVCFTCEGNQVKCSDGK